MPNIGLTYTYIDLAGLDIVLVLLAYAYTAFARC